MSYLLRCYHWRLDPLTDTWQCWLERANGNQMTIAAYLTNVGDTFDLAVRKRMTEAMLASELLPLAGRMVAA